jgi:UDP-2-acetamido-3-amino-2,3-dideoxy-glucuronate N-acetyltransferase
MTQTPHLPSLALTGAGRWGKNLARNFHLLGVLHTICDARESALASFASLYPEVRLTTQYQTVLDDPAISKVVIAAPASLHYSLAKKALLANKHVFVEKPLCLNISEAEELIHLAQKQQRILMAGHLLHYHPCVIKLQEMVKNGEIGKLQSIASHRLNLGSIRTEENALWSFAPHDISVILSLCENCLPEQVRCMGQACLSQGIPDTTLTTMRFGHGILAHIYVSWIHPFKEQKMIVIGSSGMIVFDDLKPWEEKLVIYRNPVGWGPGNIPTVNKCEGEKIPISQKEPLKEECEHFLKCCQEGLLPRTDGVEGLRVLQVLQAAQNSLDENGEAKCPTIRIPPPYFAHSTAVIDPKACIGEGSNIWHFSHIMDGAEVGPLCNIGQNVVISPQVKLGRNVKVQNNVSIYTGVICEDDVFLGPSMVFTNVMNPRSAINRRGQYQQTIVRKGATIGANATIVCGIELGAYCFIGAGAVVVKDVKPYALVVGNPARQIGWMSLHGERLDLPVRIGMHEERAAFCPVMGDTYILKGDSLLLQENQMEKAFLATTQLNAQEKCSE